MEFIDLKTQQNRIRKQLDRNISKVLDHGQVYSWAGSR